jgi:glycosyltransferase involved in cell wall biosynthesis
MNIDDLTSSKIAIFAHFSETGATEELRDWLIEKKIKELVYIAFPFGGRSKTGAEREIRISIYCDGKLAGTRGSIIRFKKPEILSFVKDFLYALFYGFLFCRKSRVLFGGDNLLSIAGNVLKFFGAVKKTVYYMIDYTPVRYNNPFINSLYYSFDRKASYGSDFVWPLCPRTIEGRFEDGRLDKGRVRWYPVPYGNHYRSFSSLFRHDRKTIVYMGRIDKLKGAELLIPLAGFLRNKSPGSFIIRVIGDGPYSEAFREEIKSLGFGDTIDFTGFVENFGDVINILLACGIAIAPYYPFDKNNYTYYADPGKIKSYLGAGLPVVLTAVPPIAPLIMEKGAGLIAQYGASSFGEKILEISRDYEGFEKRAAELGAQFDWDRVFTEAFEKLGSSRPDRVEDQPKG